MHQPPLPSNSLTFPLRFLFWSISSLHFSNLTITDSFPHLLAFNTHHANSHWQTILLILNSIHPSQLHFFLAEPFQQIRLDTPNLLCWSKSNCCTTTFLSFFFFAIQEVRHSCTAQKSQFCHTGNRMLTTETRKPPLMLLCLGY